MRFRNQRVLVTGGGSGIGEAIARKFSAEGAHIVVADVLEDRSSRVAGELEQATAVTVDVGDADSVHAMFETAGDIDILVNNAAISKGDDLATIDPDIWDLNLSVVLRGPYLCAREVLPGMKARGRGVIINIASVNGMTGLGEEPYSAAKAGLLNMTQNIAIRYGQFGIRANAISPGTVRTPIWAPRLSENPDVFDQLARWYPVGRVGEPEDIANAAAFLASDEASFITGINLPVDGGLTAGSFGMLRSLQGS